MGIDADLVPVTHAQLGAHPKFIAGPRTFKPDDEQIFDEPDVVFEFRSERAPTVCHRNLEMLAIERTQVEHLRVLNEFRPREQSLRIVGWQHVF